MRNFSQQLEQLVYNSENNKRLMETQIRESLAKLDRLSKIIPGEDARTIKARADYIELNEKFGQIMF